jgi:hypothetical protein
MRSTARRLSTTGFAALAAAALLTGCTVSNEPTAKEYVLANLEQRASVQEGSYIETSIDDVLPSREFEIEGAPAEPLAEGVVIGEITAVEPGSGYVIEGADAADGVAVPFDTADALWRVLVLTVETEKRLGDVDAKTIEVGVVIDGADDADRAEEGYLSLGRVALVLNEPGKFSFDPSLYSIRQSGALLGLVSESGKISFPALGSESAQFLGATNTVAEVVAESADKPTVVEVELDGGEFEKADR